MIFILILLLLVEFFLFYQLNGKEVLSPSIISIISFLIASLVYASHLDLYGKDLELITVLLILFYMAALFVGERLAQLIKINNINHSSGHFDNLGYTSISKRKVYFVTFFVLAVSSAYFYMTYQQSLEFGNVFGDLLTMTKYVRSAQLRNEQMDGNRFISYGCILAQVFVYYFIYVFLRNKAVGVKEYRLLLPVFAFLPYIVANNARTHVMLMIAVVFVIWYVIYACHAGWGKLGLYPILKRAVIFFFVLIAAFWGLGFRKEASSIESLERNLVQYGSFGLYGLDHYLLYGEADDVLPMQVTLDSVYNMLRNRGFDIPYFDHHGIFISAAEIDANIYSVCKPLVKQYGYLLGTIEMIFWGFLFAYIRNNLKAGKFSFTKLLILGNLMYPLAMSAIGYYHYYTISTSFLYQIICSVFVSKYFMNLHLRWMPKLSIKNNALT